ncbi:UDP-N-acetylmuramoyl-L-alanine--D-glutamate ligase [Planctomicrobium sp. SH664]|uniref:UDP-N-acetylmuramoyl-L-alanine--D-glutamate ligase n=1 Tax=Planctomicrobium sp. SH664 TaxID=3448125 RepID=UPI003F5B841A
MPASHDLSGQRVTVMGLGQFGGGLGVVQYLLQQGALVTLTDQRPAADLNEPLSRLDRSALHQLVLGEHREQDFTETDLLVVNPAVRPAGNRFLELARTAGVPLTSEIRLFWERCPAPIAAVTGTVGKSTTSTLLAHVLRAAGLPGRLGGNIGISLLPEVVEIHPTEWIVLELSSFQLASLQELQPRPKLSLVTNLYPNHLDWHGSLGDYRQAKQTICRWQIPNDVAVLNADDPDVRHWPTAARMMWFGRTAPSTLPGVTVRDDGLTLRSTATDELWIPREQFPPVLRAPYQLMNVAAALAAGMGVYELVQRQAKQIVSSGLAGLNDFTQLPHRLTTIATVQGRQFVNDSKATTPESAIAALQAFEEPVVLLAGGKDKGVDLGLFAAEIAKRAKSVVLMGETAPALEKLCRRHPALTIRSAATLEAAVEQAWELSTPGDVVLLSPGCASPAPFMNYEQRGTAFELAVQQLRNRPA